MGLPGSGKTTLAREIFNNLSCYMDNVVWANADSVRHFHNDWDFSYEGRIRQTDRMRNIADKNHDGITICDFVAPLPEMREIYDADLTIWMDTEKQSKYEDTNNCFVKPDKVDFHITEKDYKKYAKIILEHIEDGHTD